MPKLDTRRLARGTALQVLYACDLNPETVEQFVFEDSSTAVLNMNAYTLAYLTLRAYYEQGEDAINEDYLVDSEPGENVLLDLESQKLAHALVRGVRANLEKLDTVIQRFAGDWPLDQMAIIDRNILRIAIYESGIVGTTPLAVAINEAIELAKIFGSDSSPAFVNGVLGTLAKQGKEALSGLAEVREDP